MADLTADFVKQLASMVAKPELIDLGDGINRVLLANGTCAEIRPLSHGEYAAAPPRIKQTVTLRDSQSFLDYYALYSDEDSRVFADREHDRMTAVLDYHQSQDDRLHDARWGSHRAHLQLCYTEEWKTWTTHSGLQKTQQDFAEFMEQNALDIIDPASAVMLEMASSLEATIGAVFDQVTNLQNGQVQLTYREEIKGTFGGAEKKSVPKVFTILIPVYEGQQPVEMQAMIRYRIEAGKLKMWYVLMHADRLKRDAFDVVAAQVAAAGISVFNGAPA